MRWRPLLPLLGFLACSPKGSEGPGPANPETTKPGLAIPAADGVPALRSLQVALVPDGTYGPYIGEGDGSAVAVWAATAPDGPNTRRWFSVGIDPALKSQSEPVSLADAPSQIGLVVVRPSGAGGFAVVFTKPGTHGQTVEVLQLGSGGNLTKGPITISQTPDDVRWIEAIPTRSGSLALWAVRHGDRADLYAAAIDAPSPGPASAKPVFRHVRAWQAVRTEAGVVLAAVTAGQDPGMPGPVQAIYLDEKGAVDGTPVTLSATETAELDLDAARVGPNVVVAWSDRRRIDPRILRVVLDARGKVVGPAAPLTPARGAEALIRVVPTRDASRGYLAWETLSERVPGSRSIQVAPVDAQGALGASQAKIRVAADDGTLPELVATQQGLAALTLAPVCRRDTECTDPAKLPTFVELDSKLSVVATEPMILEALAGNAAELGWALTCGASGCMALAAQATAPAPVFTVRLEPRSTTWVAPAERVEPVPPPRLASVEAVAALDPFADAASIPVETGGLGAWVTFFDPNTPYERLKKPAPDGRFDPLRAHLQVAARSSAGFGEPATISLRARSLGGVALARGNPSRKENLLVWTAMDRNLPQVFTTVISDAGKKLRQQMLTRSKGEASDVAAAYTGDDAWVVGWVDERDGDPEVYVAKVNRILQRAGPERRLTSKAGGASGVTMLTRGEHVLVAWADAADNAQAGVADVFAARVKTSDGSLVGEPARLASTRAHSHSPQLAAFGTGAAVAWIEDAPEPGVRIGRLDASARFETEPVSVSVPGSPRAVSLSCGSGGCRVLVSASVEGVSVLFAGTWKPGSAVETRRVARLSGPADQAVSPVLTDGGALLADRSQEGKGIIRWMTLDWP